MTYKVVEKKGKSYVINSEKARTRGLRKPGEGRSAHKALLRRRPRDEVAEEVLINNRYRLSLLYRS